MVVIARTTMPPGIIDSFAALGSLLLADQPT
jgi:hypothetical protein